MSDKIRKNGFFYIISLSCIFCYFFTFNLDTPLFDDDLYLSSHQTFSTLYQQAVGDYFSWNGRAVGQTLWRLLVSNNQIIISVVISIVSILLLVIMYSFSRKETEVKAGHLWLVFLSTMFFAPVVGQTMFWRAGVGNYLFTTFIILLFIFPYYQWYQGRSIKRTLYILPVLSVIAGWSSENTSGGGILIVLLFMFTGFFLKKLTFNIWQFINLFSYLVGYFFLVLAPGNSIRTASQMPTWWLKQSIFSHFKSGFILVTKSLYHHYLLLIIVLFVLSLYVIYKYGVKEFILPAIWLIGGFSTIYALSLAPIGQDGGRSFFGGTIFLIIALLNLLFIILSQLDWETSRISATGVLIFSLLLAAGGIYRVGRGAVDAHYFNNAVRERYAVLDKERGSQDVVYVDRLSYYPKTKFSVGYQLEEISAKDAFIFPNAGYNIHFHLKGILLDE